jgi:hypothetical protein
MRTQRRVRPKKHFGMPGAAGRADKRLFAVVLQKPFLLESDIDSCRQECYRVPLVYPILRALAPQHLDRQPHAFPPASPGGLRQQPASGATDPTRQP